MIAKRIDMRESSKSRATRLAEYVMSEMDRAGLGDIIRSGPDHHIFARLSERGGRLMEGMK